MKWSYIAFVKQIYRTNKVSISPESLASRLYSLYIKTVKIIERAKQFKYQTNYKELCNTQSSFLFLIDKEFHCAILKIIKHLIIFNTERVY